MRNLITKFTQNEDGATLVEYGVALIVAVVVGGLALTNLAGETDASMGLACTNMQPTADASGDTINWVNDSTAC